MEKKKRESSLTKLLTNFFKYFFSGFKIVANIIYKSINFVVKNFVNGFIVVCYWLYKIVLSPIFITKKVVTYSAKKHSDVIVIKNKSKNKYKKHLELEEKKRIKEQKKLQEIKELEEEKLRIEEEKIRKIEEKEAKKISKLKETVNRKSKADILLEKKLKTKKEVKFKESKEEKEKNLMLSKIDNRKKRIDFLEEKEKNLIIGNIEKQLENSNNQINTINLKLNNNQLSQKEIGELAIKRSKLEDLISKLKTKKEKEEIRLENKFKRLREQNEIQDQKDKDKFYIKFHKEEYKIKLQNKKENEFINEVNKRYKNTNNDQTLNEALSPKIDNTVKEITQERKKESFFEKLFRNSVFEKQKESRRELSRQALLKNFEEDETAKSNVKLVYEYVAKNSEGKVVKDYFEAFSKIEVHSYLLSEGFTVYSIRTNKWIQLLHSGHGSTLSVKVKMSDVIFMCTQISTYVKAGIPLVDAIRILSRQYKKRSYQKLFSALMYDLTMGENFSNALEKQGNAFPKLLINMVRASELTGELPEALDDMADYYTHTEATKKQMVTAMTYPIIVSVVALGVMIFIMMYVIPKFVEIYNSMDGIEIPGFTLAIIALSDWLKVNIVWLLIGIVVFVLLMIYLYKNVTVIRTALQWFSMHIPVIGNVIIYNEVTMFTKTFASLLKHNVFITDSMEILSKISNNEVYKALIYDTIYNLSKGEKISTAFKDQWAFPVAAYEMIVTGEKTGQLAEMMDKVSSYYQELHRNAVGRIKTFIEPIMIIGLTVATGVIVLAVIIPMFNMYGSLSSLSQTE